MPGHDQTEAPLNELIPQVGTVDLSVQVLPELAISRDEIHVWSANLDCESDALPRFKTILSPDEKSRADRFVFARDRNRFIVARGTLRELLGTYLRTPPEILEFTYGKYGKPYLRTPNPSSAHLQFNLSHSHGVAVYAIAHNRNVGVDVELVRTGFATESIAERYFSARELEELRPLPPEEQCRGFFRCWTRKEACLKAQGSGFMTALDSFDVTVASSAAARFLAGAESSWNLATFTPARHYVAALVYGGSTCQVERLFRYAAHHAGYECFEATADIVTDEFLMTS